MKLPDDKSERTKLFVLFSVVGAIALYYLADKAVRPMFERKAQRREQIEQLKSEIETARQVMSFIDKSRDLNRQTVAEIVRIAETDNCVLKARLGNYLLEATEILDRQAQAAAVPFKAAREVGMADLPSLSGESGPSVFRLYTVRVEAECGIADLIRLLRALEEHNPYLCIAALGITGRPASPALHAVTFDVQWLIWKDEALPAQIKESAQPREDPL